MIASVFALEAMIIKKWKTPYFAALKDLVTNIFWPTLLPIASLRLQSQQFWLIQVQSHQF